MTFDCIVMQQCRELKLRSDEATLRFNEDREHSENLLKMEVKKVENAEQCLRRVTAALSSNDTHAALLQQILDAQANADNAIAEVIFM